MFVVASDRKKLTTLSKSKVYRDTYLSSHVRAGIAYQIQALREKLGLSQAAFARKISMKQSVVSRLENPDYGKVTVQTLLQVAAALDIALHVRFCDYQEFLAVISDVSPEALAVNNISETIEGKGRHPPLAMQWPANPISAQRIGSSGSILSGLVPIIDAKAA
jgi:transcriptional regulator with XRE-family HTH domain